MAHEQYFIAADLATSLALSGSHTEAATLLSDTVEEGHHLLYHLLYDMLGPYHPPPPPPTPSSPHPNSTSSVPPTHHVDLSPHQRYARPHWQHATSAPPPRLDMAPPVRLDWRGGQKNNSLNTCKNEMHRLTTVKLTVRQPTRPRTHAHRTSLYFRYIPYL